MDLLQTASMRLRSLNSISWLASLTTSKGGCTVEVNWVRSEAKDAIDAGGGVVASLEALAVDIRGKNFGLTGLAGELFKAAGVLFIAAVTESAVVRTDPGSNFMKSVRADSTARARLTSSGISAAVSGTEPSSD